MVTTIGTESSLPDLIENLAHLEHDAIAAYKEAVDRLDDPGFKSAMQDMLDDHERHASALGDLCRTLGRTPPTGGDMKQMLTTGKVKLADMLGDKAILKAMQTNEQDTNTAYDRAVTHDDLTPEARPVLEKAQKDEHRHKAWIEETLAKL